MQQNKSDKNLVRELTCIRCPIGCQLKVFKDGDSYRVEGNRCPRGEEYGITEITNPERILTTTVKVSGGFHPVVSVRTKDAIPKAKIFAAMSELKKVMLKAPIKVGDVVLKNVVQTGVDVVATHDNPLKNEQ